ncbi:MAG TPA: DUF2079 domain-containing protein [Trebonia sp.]
MLGEPHIREVTADRTVDDASGAPVAGGRGPRGTRRLAVLRAALTAPPGSVWRDPVTWAIAVAVFAAYFVISLFRLLQLAPGSYDFGIYTEYVKQLSQLHAPVVDILGPGFNLLGNHFQPAVGVIAPFFRLFPSPATLLFFQALSAAVSVFPVVTVGFAFTERSTGRLIGLAYGFSWGLQQMIDFDFHEIALAVPLLAFAVAALVRRRQVAAIAWAVPLVFVKEDQGFTVAAIGVLLGASAAFPRLLPPPSGSVRRVLARRRWPAWLGGRLLRDRGPWGEGYVALWGGLFLVAWGLFWSTFAITMIIPHFNPLHEYYFWSDGGTVGGGKKFSAGALLGQAGGGWPTKAPTIVMLLLPTAFAALGSPVTLLALPSLALRFVSTNSMFWGTAYHYNATVMPILFIAAADGIRRWRRASEPSWPAPGSGPLTGSRPVPRPAAGSGPVQGSGPILRRLRPPGRVRNVARAARSGVARHGGAMMAAIAVALAFQFPLSNLWQASTYRLDAHVAAANAAMAVVPDGATVQTTLDLLAPLAARTDTFWIGTPGNPVTQYIVFDGADSGYSPPVTNVPKFIKNFYSRDGYVPVFQRDDVYVYRRS